MRKAGRSILLRHVSSCIEVSLKKYSNINVTLTNVYIVSYAVLRASRPSSTLCVQGPIWTVRIRSGLMTVSLYKFGRRVVRFSRISWGLVRVAELRADNASLLTVWITAVDQLNDRVESEIMAYKV